MATVNISIPDKMYKDVKRAVKVKSYTSVSELVRAAVRKVLYEEITENGFTPAFEDQVLESAMEPKKNDKVWETPEDIRRDFDKLRERVKLKSGQNQKNRQLHKATRQALP